MCNELPGWHFRENQKLTEHKLATYDSHLNNVIIDVSCYFRFRSPLPFVEGSKAAVDECGVVVEGFTLILCVVVFLEGTTTGAFEVCFVVVVVVDLGVVFVVVLGVVVVVVDGVVVMVRVGTVGLLTVVEPLPIAAGLELFVCD